MAGILLPSHAGGSVVACLKSHGLRRRGDVAPPNESHRCLQHWTVCLSRVTDAIVLEC